MGCGCSKRSKQRAPETSDLIRFKDGDVLQDIVTLSKPSFVSLAPSSDADLLLGAPKDRDMLNMLGLFQRPVADETTKHCNCIGKTFVALCWQYSIDELSTGSEAQSTGNPPDIIEKAFWETRKIITSAFDKKFNGVDVTFAIIKGSTIFLTLGNVNSRVLLVNINIDRKTDYVEINVPAKFAACKVPSDGAPTVLTIEARIEAKSVHFLVIVNNAYAGKDMPIVDGMPSAKTVGVQDDSAQRFADRIVAGADDAKAIVFDLRPTLQDLEAHDMF